jgi:hypothetical protein
MKPRNAIARIAQRARAARSFFLDATSRPQREQRTKGYTRVTLLDDESRSSKI